MIAAIVWLFAMCTQLRKCEAGDIVASLASLKNVGPSWSCLSRLSENSIKLINKV